MLASRGPIYTSASSAVTGPVLVGDTFKAHDRCRCVPEPVYRADAPWPRGSERYAQLWQESTRGLGGDEAIAAFRAAVEA